MAIILPDITTLNNIKNELGEDPGRLEKQMELFQEWLQCENYLPNDVDAHLRQNFLRLCKCNLGKAKEKFEKFLAARINFSCYYANRIINETYFETFPVHRQLNFLPQLTPDGYRVGLITLPKSVEQFDFFHLVHFGIFLVDFVLCEDIFAGVICVYDFENYTVQLLAKINIKTALNVVDFLYNVCPFRVKQIHLLNVPAIAEVSIELAKRVISDKLAKRIIVHRKPEDLAKYIPKNILPEKYGGHQKSLDLVAEANKSHFIQNKNWYSKVENLKFTGPVPPNRKHLYNLDEFQMEGSFRKLNID